MPRTWLDVNDAALNFNYPPPSFPSSLRNPPVNPIAMEGTERCNFCRDFRTIVIRDALRAREEIFYVLHRGSGEALLYATSARTSGNFNYYVGRGTGKREKGGCRYRMGNLRRWLRSGGGSHRFPVCTECLWPIAPPRYKSRCLSRITVLKSVFSGFDNFLKRRIKVNYYRSTLARARDVNTPHNVVCCSQIKKIRTTTCKIAR